MSMIMEAQLKVTIMEKDLLMKLLNIKKKE